MKKLFTIFLVLATLVAGAQNEKAELSSAIKLTSLGLSSGQGPLSAGLFFEANFSRKNDLINISLGERDMYVIYLKNLTSKKPGILMSGPSLEWYYNVPTLGVMTILTPWQNDQASFTLMNWSGISAGNPEEKAKLANWRFLFFWQSASINYKNFTAMAAVLNYDYNWGHLVDFKYVQPINPQWSTFASAGYNWYDGGKALLKLGIVYKL